MKKGNKMSKIGEYNLTIQNSLNAIGYESVSEAFNAGYTSEDLMTIGGIYD